METNPRNVGFTPKSVPFGASGTIHFTADREPAPGTDSNANVLDVKLTNARIIDLFSEKLAPYLLPSSRPVIYAICRDKPVFCSSVPE